MNPPSSQAQPVPDDDELDAILNGIVEGRDLTEENNTRIESQPDYQSTKKNANAGSLGIDEEIVITKKRTPAPKLDDQRLLSDPGIPRLQRISKERLRFKGKGHEVWAGQDQSRSFAR